MSATRLSLYNDALLSVGQAPLATLTDNVEGRNLLDQVWNNGGVNLCLEEAQWEFAMRTGSSCREKARILLSSVSPWMASCKSSGLNPFHRR